MSNPTQQHFVPACYLREFVDPGSPSNKPYLWIFSKDGKIKRHQKPENTFRFRDLHTIKIEGRKDYKIEESLGKIEAQYASIFRDKIKKNFPLLEQEHTILCIFVAAMLQRTLKKKDNIEQFLDQLIEHGEILASQHNVRSENVERLKRERKDVHKFSILDSLPDIASILVQMNIAFLCIKEKESCFITSDDPCTLFNPDIQWQKFYGPGLAQKNIQLTLPLSPHITLCLSWSNYRGYVWIKRKLIEDLNRMTRAHCYKEFICPTDKTKIIWFSKYPLDLAFIIKIFLKKIRIHFQKTKFSVNYFYARVKRKIRR